jgi:diguanylate cyclase (GGDEF)-like protein
MPQFNLGQISLLGIQATLVSVLLLVLFRLRNRFRLSLLFITLGAFQQMQMTLALSFYVEIAPGVSVSPGSIVLFTSSLFVALLIYIREDAAEARKLIYGLVIANLSIEAFSFLLGRQFNTAGMNNLFGLPRDIFVHDPRIALSGSLALLIDIIVVIILYEWVSRHVPPQFLFLRIYVSMVLVLSLDTLVFTAGSFWGKPIFFPLLLSGWMGKVLISLFFAGVLSLYLHFFEKPEYLEPRGDVRIQDIFEMLTYRQKYEVLREKVIRDPLTGLYNRGFFDDNLPKELERASRLRHPLALLMLDVDHFKQYNDSMGHPAGDRVLALVGTTLTESLRSGDLACRYGGEEFVAILPDADPRFARVTAERIRTNLRNRWEQTSPPLPGARVTITMGASFFPNEATSVPSLVMLADQRLYLGKRGGRDRIVLEDVLEAGTSAG